MTDPDDLGEVLFNAYVRQRPDLRAQRHELSGTRRPDFTLSSPAGEVICEVYSPSLPLDGGGSFDSFGPVSRAFKSRKRRQGAAAKANNIPYVVVVTDTNSDVPFGEFDLMVAMFGRENDQSTLVRTLDTAHSRWCRRSTPLKRGWTKPLRPGRPTTRLCQLRYVLPLRLKKSWNDLARSTQRRGFAGFE